VRRDALARAGVSATALDLIAAPELKRGERGIVVAAAALGVPLVLVAVRVPVLEKSEPVLVLANPLDITIVRALADRTSQAVMLSEVGGSIGSISTWDEGEAASAGSTDFGGTSTECRRPNRTGVAGVAGPSVKA